MADLIGRTVGQPYGARAVWSNLPEVKLVIKKDGGVILGPTSDAERRLLFDGPVGFAIDESGWSVFGDIDDRARGGVDGPIVVVVKAEEVAAAGTFFEVVVIVEMILNFSARAGGNVDERNISRWAADGAVHGVGGPVGGNGEKLVLESSDALVQVFAKWNERVLLEVPRSKHVFLTVVFCAELLFGHDFNVAPVPDGDRRRLVFVLVFIFGSLRVFRSEEHTSELQSRLHLVCRLLLEKKKKSIADLRHRL